MVRDDSNLSTLYCPHCNQPIPIINIQAFEKQQLVFIRCESCDKGITKQQIDDAYKEYTGDTDITP